MVKRQETEARLKDCCVKDGFWSYFQELVSDVVIPYQEKILRDEIPGIEKSHAIENFRIAAGKAEGEFYGAVFQDSDLAKWLEAAAYSLQNKRDEELERRVDDVIDLIGGAQQEDGYVNTYFTIKEPEHRWQNLLDCHELYCAGHMIEAAVAYYESTGKDKFLNIMRRMADHIDRRFGPDKTRGIPGHEEIELALLRLYRATGEQRYLELSRYFIDERGTQPNYFQVEMKERSWTFWSTEAGDGTYNQSHVPVREQDKAVGHSVRAMYLYTAMADMAGETGDESLYRACLRLWENVTGRQMYVTGGIGSTVHGEAFTKDYDLPNDTVYAETCASIGLVFFTRKMLELKPSGKFADVMERCLFNGVLSGMQHDGKRFFYVNPLEVIPGLSGEQKEYKHVIPKRPQWYACACCPPNEARLLESIGKYAWGEGSDTIYSHMFLGGSYRSEMCGGILIETESGYPWNGSVKYTVHPQENGASCTLAVHIPGWCEKYRLLVNGTEALSAEGTTAEAETAAKAADVFREDGYCYIRREWKDGDTVQVDLQMEARRVYADSAVRENQGRVCLMRGPVVYCLEQEDNGGQLWQLRIPENAQISAAEEQDPVLGRYVSLNIEGARCLSGGSLYTGERPVPYAWKIKAVPYYLWGNRSEGGMQVWTLEG
ncbi:glycoside hydrolase family 127 protein [Murimonas intestini]|uniref:Glycoside hydrolase family 127 protein n=1 Tax=Murimonas intestini TaxID=1337051 RepID=A0AB73T4T8_9FIRM|nr:beta-L-arabinofuranosidase domain-containing protein [Murimonas intestini]MCR1840555.1 glycoside hydrolase family 127 protein [Murimonas intestini]MCR1865391.1 glycoside hydrolase family 127 protein [Murimonas intestini]MCR1882898.1 glycoside hydrolase family 127 protein [Murimonas intestini]